MEKKILDVTCGGRSIWFNKHHPAAVYCDKRREQVEKVFPGCRSCKSCRSCVFCINNLKDMPCKKCDPNAECVVTEYKPSNFCPVCGKPLTDEAVQMVMERLEELRDDL